MDPKLKEAFDGIKQTVEDGVKGVKEELGTKIDDINGRVEALEKSPAQKAFNINTQTSARYKGYKMSEMGASVREKMALMKQRGVRFGALDTDEGMENFSKFAIDVVRAIRGDINAKMALHQKASDLAEGTENLGGYTVPEEFQSDIIMLAKNASFLLQNATVIPMSTDVRKVPAELTRGSVAWIDEAGSITESNPTFSQVTLTAKKLAGLTSGISNELLADTAIDLPSLLMDQFTYAIGQELDNQGLNGTGSPCSGVLTAKAGNSVVMSLANFSSISADNLSLMIAQLAASDAAQAKFVYNQLIQHYIRTLKDDNNNYIYQGIANGNPNPTIWGRPAIESANATGTTGASTAFVALGNWKYFYVGQRKGIMTLDANPYSDFANDQTSFRIVTRWALAVARANAFVRLVTGS